MTIDSLVSLDRGARRSKGFLSADIFVCMCDIREYPFLILSLSFSLLFSLSLSLFFIHSHILAIFTDGV